MASKNCLNCNASDQEKPLINMDYQSKNFYICPQCLPVLIHKPATLAAKLPGADKFDAAQHEH